MVINHGDQIIIDTEKELSDQEFWYKNNKLESCSMEFKKDVVKYIKENSSCSAAKKFKVNCKSFHEWVQNDNKLVPMNRTWFGLDGIGQKLAHVEFKEHVLG